jgi:hypothetical protein
MVYCMNILVNGVLKIGKRIPVLVQEYEQNTTPDLLTPDGLQWTLPCHSRKRNHEVPQNTLIGSKGVG